MITYLYSPGCAWELLSDATPTMPGQFRVLLLNTDYRLFLAWLYASQPALALARYERQLAARNASLFGTADFMSSPLNARGIAAIDIHANNRPLQEAWMAEHRRQIRGWPVRLACSAIPGRLKRRLVDRDRDSPRFLDILRAQIAAFAPTVLYNHDPSGIPAASLKAVLPRDCALVAQIASPPNPDTDWPAYDLVISSLPNLVAAFRCQNVAAEYLPLAFEPRILAQIPEGPRDIPVSFVGSVSPAHRERLDFLETVSGRMDLAIWSDLPPALAVTSIIRTRHRGSAWGREMFHILRRSQITLNRHIDVSANFANNMRLFEATGMGACLVTDAKDNLAELFEPGKEVVTYASADECMATVRDLTGHPAERQRIAAAGQARCLADHTYERRMAELVAILTRRFG